MSITTLQFQLKPYIQPFERQLALMELESLSGTVPEPVSLHSETPLVYKLRTTKPLEYFVDSLTYWESVFTDSISTILYTKQLKREASANIVKNGITLEQLRDRFPFDETTFPRPNRRVLRYGTHGAHEYRGKFFPQLVHSLLNLSKVPPMGTVLDPMCGSGTTPVEAILSKYNVIGVDMNPLSIYISRVKCSALKLLPDVIAKEYKAINKDLEDKAWKTINGSWFEQLPKLDQSYLESWFSNKVLKDLDAITYRINEIENHDCRDLFKMCLSNILRKVSWQKIDDLRVRKQIREDNSINVQSEYLGEISRTVRMLLAFLYGENEDYEFGNAQIIEGDARNLVGKNAVLDTMKNKVSVVLTSPPYATALPYLDTDRLSLCYLGLLSRADHRDRDREMIGNREISGKQKTDYWEAYENYRSVLPEEVRAIIETIQSLNSTIDVGFRRQNLPSLLARYFLDMRLVLMNIFDLLVPGGKAYIIIGNNHTIAGGIRIDIETDKFLALIGESANLSLEQVIPMNMLVSRDIFKKNAVGSESILCFRKPK